MKGIELHRHHHNQQTIGGRKNGRRLFLPVQVKFCLPVGWCWIDFFSLVFVTILLIIVRECSFMIKIYEVAGVFDDANLFVCFTISTPYYRQLIIMLTHHRFTFPIYLGQYSNQPNKQQ